MSSSRIVERPDWHGQTYSGPSSSAAQYGRYGVQDSSWEIPGENPTQGSHGVANIGPVASPESYGTVGGLHGLYAPAQTHPDGPPPYSPPSKMLPFVIPQVATSWQGPFMCPFARAYPMELQHRGIDQAHFLQFLDGFNEAFIGSPAFQVTNLAGTALSLGGTPSLQIAGTSISAASGFLSAGISYGRAKAFMKKANNETFHPVGLHGQVLTTKKLLPKINYPHEKLQLLPIEHEQLDLDSVHPSDSSSSSSDSDSEAAVRRGTQSLSRRSEALNGYVQPLNYDVPPSVASNNLLKRMGEWQSKRLAAKQQKKLDKERAKGNKEYRKKMGDASKEKRKLDKEIEKLESKIDRLGVKTEAKVAKERARGDLREAQKVEREYEKERAKLDKEMAKEVKERNKEIQKHTREGSQERGKADRKEQKMANKVRWIVITEWVPENAGDELEDEDEERSDMT